jgi:hypothetical protein
MAKRGLNKVNGQKYWIRIHPLCGKRGVTLEASKWAQVLKSAGHNYFWFAGLLDRSPDRCFLVPEAFFQHEKNIWIDQQIFGQKRRDPAVTDAIYELKTFLKNHCS